MEQAVVEFGMREGKVEDVNQFQRVAAANVFDQFGRQVQDRGCSGARGLGGICRVGGLVVGDDDIGFVVVGFALSFQSVGRHRTDISIFRLSFGRVARPRRSKEWVFQRVCP